MARRLRSCFDLRGYRWNEVATQWVWYPRAVSFDAAARKFNRMGDAMKLSTGMWVAVVDGGRGVVLVNEGSAFEPRLKVVRSHDGGDNPASHEQGDDRPGRVVDSAGHHRSSTEAPDLHQRAEDRFVAEFVTRLTEDAAAGLFDKLVIAAPPVALGVLRKHVRAPLADLIVKEIAADYVKMPVDGITKVIVAALDT